MMTVTLMRQSLNSCEAAGTPDDGDGANYWDIGFHCTDVNSYGSDGNDNDNYYHDDSDDNEYSSKTYLEPSIDGELSPA